jgi:hypothetical protein
MSASLGMEEVRLINDFVANGYGLLTLDEATETVTIQVPRPLYIRTAISRCCITHVGDTHRHTPCQQIRRDARVRLEMAGHPAQRLAM